MDAMVLEDGREVIVDVCALVESGRAQGSSRADLLRQLSQLAHVYVPSLLRESTTGRSVLGGSIFASNHSPQTEKIAMKSAIVILTVIATILVHGLASITPAVAVAPPTLISASAVTSSTQFTQSDFVSMALALRVSDTPRTSVWADDGTEWVTYNLENLVFLRIPYGDGHPYVPSISKTKAGIRPDVRFGAVWWSAYVELNSAEQAALATGAAGTIVAALFRNPATVGIATTIVAVATANGVCSRGRTLRIYFPSFLMSECR